MSQSAPSERSFSVGVKTGQLLGGGSRDRIEGEDGRTGGKMEGSEVDTGGRAGTRPFLALSLPPISVFSPLKPLLSSVISVTSDPNTVLCVCGTQLDCGSLETKRTLLSCQIPLLSHLTSCRFLPPCMCISKSVMIDDRHCQH